MSHLKMLGLAAIAATALMAVGPTAASATTLEVGGVAKNSSVELGWSMKAGGTATWVLTGGSFANKCSTTQLSGKTEGTFTGASIGGKVSSLTFSTCTTEKVEVVKPGSLDIAWISGTTNGTVTSTNTEVKVPSPIGTLTCVTPAAGKDIGTLTGKASSQAELDINTVLNCGFLAPSLTFQASVVFTVTFGLGVVN